MILLARRMNERLSSEHHICREPIMIIFGTSLYGKCDEVPGLFHVATNFVHIYYIPLLPTGSHVVLGKEGDTWHGAPCGLSLKSLFIAWMRTAAIVTIIGGGVLFMAVMVDEDFTGMMMIGALCAVAIFFLIWSYRAQVIARASYRRAMQLADKIGLSDEGKLMIDLAYGKITEAEVEAIMAEAENARSD